MVPVPGALVTVRSAPITPGPFGHGREPEVTGTLGVRVEARPVVAHYHPQDVRLGSDADGRAVGTGMLDHVMKGL